jgi:hypothetical protein
MGVGEPKVSCDYCSEEKREVNHWYLLRFCQIPVSITIMPFDLQAFTRHSDKVACGQECVLKAVAQHMSTPPQEPNPRAYC